MSLLIFPKSCRQRCTAYPVQKLNGHSTFYLFREFRGIFLRGSLCRFQDETQRSSACTRALRRHRSKSACICAPLLPFASHAHAWCNTCTELQWFAGLRSTKLDYITCSLGRCMRTFIEFTALDSVQRTRRTVGCLFSRS